MTGSLLIVDSNYLARRAMHIFKTLEFEDNTTGVCYGFLRDLSYLTRVLPPISNVAFAWDDRESVRKGIYPPYKANRVATGRDKLEQAKEDSYHRQVKTLRTKLLPAVGFRNVFRFDGYEADDVIARVCERHPSRTKIIVTADEDMFQLLDRNTYIWNPHKKLNATRKWFRDTYGIKPGLWADVKATAGCSSDNVVGCPRVGEKTAIAYATGELGERTKAFAAIQQFHRSPQFKLNRKLVKLPFKTCPEAPNLKKTVVDRDAWFSELKRLGIRGERLDPPTIIKDA